MSQKRIIVWYRNNLRIHDHEPLYRASQETTHLFPLYCFDDRQFQTTSYGFPKTGSYRAKFLIDSVANLRHNLSQLNSTLIIRQGLPETIIPSLVKEHKITAVYFYGEVTSEELAVEKAVKTALMNIGIPIKCFWGSTLYHIQDLPFLPEALPTLFTNFRKAIEKKASVRETFPQPRQLTALTNVDCGELPKLSQWALEEPVVDPRGVLPFIGGEDAGLGRLNQYIWQQNRLKDYKITRNGMLGADYSSKFSPWLALGCLSPRFIFEAIKQYEAERVKNQSTYWLIFELLWRDFFRLTCLKYGSNIFRPSGIQGIMLPWKEDWAEFEDWQKGLTGYPLVDANMRELAATGFMSNRGRQNVASFLTKNLGINWIMGAEWFESLLIDYDVCSNWGNWNYVAGVGNDARGFRYFNIPKQSRDYDKQGHYLRHWLPEIASIPGDKIHEPGKLSRQEQQLFSVSIGSDYPRPMVNFFKSIKQNEKLYQQAILLT